MQSIITVVASVFTQIIKKKLPGHFLWRDSSCVAFLSINPITPGHSLIVPMQETDHWLDLPNELSQHLTKVGHFVGLALQKVFNPARVGMMIAGFEVPHTHLHILCINSMADMDFANASQDADHFELAQTSELIRKTLDEAGHSEFTADS